jgi:hypothetical protein
MYCMYELLLGFAMVVNKALLFSDNTHVYIYETVMINKQFIQFSTVKVNVLHLFVNGNVYLFELLFYPDDEGSTSLRNIGKLLLNYTESYLRRRNMCVYTHMASVNIF